MQLLSLLPPDPVDFGLFVRNQSTARVFRMKQKPTKQSEVQQNAATAYCRASLSSVGAVVATCLIGVFVWQLAKGRLELEAQDRFNLNAQRVAQKLEDRIRSQSEFAAGLVTTGYATEADNVGTWWRDYARTAELDPRQPVAGRPGVLLAIPSERLNVRRTLAKRSDSGTAAHPLHFEIPEFYLDVAYPGTDLQGGKLLDANRLKGHILRPGALLARDAGHSVAVRSGESARSAGAYRFLLLTPFYGIGSAMTLYDRQHNFVGLLATELDLNAVTADGAIPGDSYSVRLFVDGDPISSEASEEGANTAFSSAAHFRRIEADIFGRRWSFNVTGKQTFDSDLPRIILGAFLFVAGLFAAAAAFGLRATRRAAVADRRVRAELERRLSEAQRTSADLESFSYIVSHDLRTPLRGVATLSELIAEELEDEDVAGDTGASAVGDYLKKIDVQIARMSDLIKGIHDYSTVGLSDDLIAEIDTRETVLGIGSFLSVGKDQLVLSGEFPMLRTYAIRFEQTMANLIGNAFKYHDDPQSARVEVSVASFGDFYAFSVIDDGPGIAAENHDRIFEVFQAVKREGVESSGVGLSIVKKAVESLGGVIGVESEPGAGATFRFLWPKEIDGRTGTSR